MKLDIDSQELQKLYEAIDGCRSRNKELSTVSQALHDYLLACYELESFLRLYPVSDERYDGLEDRRDDAFDRLWPFFPELEVVRNKSNTMTRAAALIGRVGGQSTSEAKRAAVRENGKKGGRPKKAPTPR